MIIKKTWKKYHNHIWMFYTGWFLFGILPLYITRQKNMKEDVL